MKVRLDKEDDIFLIPTVVISRINGSRLKVTLTYIAWLKWSIVFIPKV